MEVKVNVDEMREAGPALLSAKKAAAFCGISVRQWWRWNWINRIKWWRFFF